MKQLSQDADAARDEAATVVAGAGAGLGRLREGASRSNFMPIAQELPLPLYVTDLEGFIVYHNAAAAALWGRELAPGERRWWGGRLLRSRSGARVDPEQSPMASLDRPATELVTERPDGALHTFIPHSKPLPDRDGRVAGAVHLLVEVIDRDRSDEDTHRLAAIVESSDDAIISKQLDGTITSWNGAAQRLFGYAPDEIIGRSVLTLIPEDRHGEEIDIVDRLRRGERIQHFETVRRHKSGAMLDISLTISPIKRPDGTIIGASKIARDITQRKQAEELQRRQAKRLEILNRVSRIISQDLDLDRIVRAVTDEATALSAAEFGAFFYNVTDAAGETYLLYSLSGAPREAFDGFGMPRNTAIFAPTFSGEGVVRSADITKDPRYGQNLPHKGMPEGHLPVVSYLAVPVTSSSGEVIGGLFFGHSQADRFGPETEVLISAIAAQAAVAMDNARLHRAAQAEIAQRKEAESAKELLLHEVKHRVKNTLATIQALAMQTLKGSPTEERDAFITRLHALSGAHDLLTASDWQGVGIAALAGQSLAPFSGQGEGRVSCEGPDVGLTANKALLLTMVLHELGTNAVKYGALSIEQGRVDVAWQKVRGDRPALRIEWRESGGPSVTPPTRRGFGSRMISAALQGSDGNVAFEYRPEGLRVSIDLAL
jgi:PAS domain S-box-containing protein